MKHLFICLLAVLLTACSGTTPLVEMTKYEIQNNEELQELDIEYITYAEMYEEPVDDWLFDMDKNVMEDDAIVGYEVTFPDRSEDETGISFSDFGDFLRFAFGTEQEEFDMELVDESYGMYTLETTITDSSDGNKYLVYFSGDSTEEEYIGVNFAEMYITD